MTYFKYIILDKYEEYKKDSIFVNNIQTVNNDVIFIK